MKLREVGRVPKVQLKLNPYDTHRPNTADVKLIEKKPEFERKSLFTTVSPDSHLPLTHSE